MDMESSDADHYFFRQNHYKCDKIQSGITSKGGMLMKESIYREETHYLRNDYMVGEDTLNVMKDAIRHNNAVGTLVGYYDDELTIVSVSDFLLYNLGYSCEEFEEFSKGSLRNLMYGENQEWSKPGRFQTSHGAGEGQMIASDGTLVEVRLYKEDSQDVNGEAVWVLAVGVDWEQENLALVTDAIRSGSWYLEYDKEGTLREVRWSRAFRKMLGYHDSIEFPNEMDTWLELLHPMDKGKILNSLERAVVDRTNETKFNLDCRVQMRNGSYRWHRIIGEITRRRDGSARRIAGVLINIDRDKKTMMQIHKANTFHMAFTKYNLCEYYVDVENNTFESLKMEDSVLLSYEQSNNWESLVQNFVDDFVCEEDKLSVQQFLDRTQMKKNLEGTKHEFDMECQISLQGERRWIKIANMICEVEDMPYVLVWMRDVTEAKYEEERNRQMQEENEAMGHLLYGMMRVVDQFSICDLEKDEYEYHNINVNTDYPKSGQYTDFIRMIAGRFKMLESEESMEECLQIENVRKRLCNKDDIYRFEYCSKDETIFRMASFIPLEWKSEKLTKFLCISLDVTEAKRTEMESRRVLKDALLVAEHANRAKTEFLSNMSHDIRTPMNAIVGLTAIATANIEHKDKVLESLGKITRASRHLLGLINEVLDMARIESGRISLAEEDFYISELVDNLIVMVKPGMEEHGHELEVNIRHMEHEVVCGDSLRIQQVLTNLLSNAMKYTPDGGHIKFSIEEKTNGFSELGCFCFCIEDDGIGMTEEFQNIMFQPFSRADDHRTTSVQGTGLGMTIAYNIVELMNGDIKVESAPERGTKVTVTIYLRLLEKDRSKIKELVDLPVLVVDDEQVICESTVETLKEIGIDGEWVTSGQRALECVCRRHEQGEDYFAVLIDWTMPKMDGIQTTKKIRERVGNEIPIIMFSSYDYSSMEDEAREAGVNVFITKPLFRSRLVAAFKKLLCTRPECEDQNHLTNLKNVDYSHKRILLVEDNELNREIAMQIIAMSKVQIETAENGKIALDKVRCAPEGYYDLVFMDIQMPVMNGYEATKAIRSLEGEKSKIPIVAMTANAFAEDVQKAKNTGMNGHIAKPLDFGKLFIALKQWLGT